MPTIKQHNSRSVPQRTPEGTASNQKKEDRNPPIINNHSEDRNAPITNSHGAAYNETQPIDIIAWWRPAVSGRNVAIHTHVRISWEKRLISYHFKLRWITYSVTLFLISINSALFDQKKKTRYPHKIPVWWYSSKKFIVLNHEDYPASTRYYQTNVIKQWFWQNIYFT